MRIWALREADLESIIRLKRKIMAWRKNADGALEYYYKYKKVKTKIIQNEK